MSDRKEHFKRIAKDSKRYLAENTTDLWDEQKAKDKYSGFVNGLIRGRGMHPSLLTDGAKECFLIGYKINNF